MNYIKNINDFLNEKSTILSSLIKNIINLETKISQYINDKIVLTKLIENVKNDKNFENLKNINKIDQINDIFIKIKTIHKNLNDIYDIIDDNKIIDLISNTMSKFY
jgi:uncharacterized membrane protein